MANHILILSVPTLQACLGSWERPFSRQAKAALDHSFKKGIGVDRRRTVVLCGFAPKATEHLPAACVFFVCLECASPMRMHSQTQSEF